MSGSESAELYGGSGNNVINARTFHGGTFISAYGGDDVIVGGLGRDRARVDRLDTTRQIEAFFF